MIITTTTRAQTLALLQEDDAMRALRLIRALAVETHEEWIDGSRYLNMEPLRAVLKKPAPVRNAA